MSPQKVIEQLKNIINPKHTLELLDENMLVLSENKPDSKFKKLKIKGIKKPYFAFKLDALNPNKLSEYLHPKTENIHKACDGIFFVVFEDKAYVFLCELKSSDNGKKEYFGQFLNTNCFLDYLEILLKEHYELDFSGFERKFCLFYLDKEIEDRHELKNMAGKRSSPILISSKEYKLRKFAFKYVESEIYLEELLRK